MRVVSNVSLLDVYCIVISKKIFFCKYSHARLFTFSFLDMNMSVKFGPDLHLKWAKCIKMLIFPKITPNALKNAVILISRPFLKFRNHPDNVQFEITINLKFYLVFSVCKFLFSLYVGTEKVQKTILSSINPLIKKHQFLKLLFNKFSSILVPKTLSKQKRGIL